MKQINVPKKFTAMGQLWISLLLIVLATIFAFTPIVSLNMSDNDLWDGVQGAVNALSEKVPALAKIEKPEDNIGITSSKVLTSVKIVTKLVAATASTAKQDADAQEKLDELTKLVESEEGQESIIMTVAIFSQLIDFGVDEVAESEDKVDTGIGAVIETIIKFMMIAYLLAYILLWPYIMLVIAIVSGLRAIKNIKTPENVAGKVGGVLAKPFSFALVLTFILTFLPGFSWGSGIKAVFVCSIISIVGSIVLTRLRSYKAEDLRYVNLAQGAALLQGVGFIVFFANLLKTDILFGFFKALGKYVIDAAAQIANITITVRSHNEFSSTKLKYPTIGAAFLVDLLLVVLFLSLAIATIRSFSKSVINPLSLTSKKSSSAIYSLPVLAIITSVLPMIVGKLESKQEWVWPVGQETWVTNKIGTIFEISAAHQSALVAMLISGIIMLAVAVAFSVLKNKLCPDITAEREAKILSGNAEDFNA